MSGGIAGQLNQAAANTAYLAAADGLFARPPEGPWSLFTDVVPCDGQTLEIDALGPSPIVRELVGSRRYGSLRSYARRERVVMYSTDALELSRLQVEKDKSGIVSKRLSDYLSASANFWDKPVIDKLLANPVGIDGVSILNDSHSYGAAGATWDNKVTIALSPDTFNTGIVAMAGVRFENGEPAGMYPTHLVCGPKLEKMARDLCENAFRPFPMAATGLEAYVSALAPTAIPNWMAGKIQVVISARFVDGTHDDDWLLMDLSKPGVRPIIMGEALAPRAVVVDDPQSEPMLQRSSYAYYVEGAAAIGGYIPHCIYGRLS